MKNRFDEKVEDLEFHKWISVDDCSEQLGVSVRTIFKYLKEGKIRGVKWKNYRLVDSVSVIGFLLEKKVTEINKIKSREVKEQIELKEFQQL
jgi:predicted site-specific integrase-resolvase